MKENILNDGLILDSIRKSSLCKEELSKLLGISKNELEDYFNKKSINKVEIFVDGGSRGNPGESGSGVVFVENNIKTGYYFYNGQTTNNEAEYKALVKAVEIARQKKIQKIEIYSDSELVCNQINGIYKVKNENLKLFYLKVKKMICDFEEFSLNYIPREKNKDADKMANFAMDLKKNGEVELTAAL